jgi:hypothetical protein
MSNSQIAERANPTVAYQFRHDFLECRAEWREAFAILRAKRRHWEDKVARLIQSLDFDLE